MASAPTRGGYTGVSQSEWRRHIHTPSSCRYKGGGAPRENGELVSINPSLRPKYTLTRLRLMTNGSHKKLIAFLLYSYFSSVIYPFIMGLLASIDALPTPALLGSLTTIVSDVVVPYLLKYD